MGSVRIAWGQRMRRRAAAWIIAIAALASGLGAPSVSQAQGGLAAANTASRSQWKALDRQAQDLLTREGFQPGQGDAALAAARQALALAEAQLGPEDPDTLTSVERVSAASFRYLGFHRVDMLDRVVATRTRLLGRGHPDTVRALKLLATAHYAFKDLEKSDRLYRELYDLALAAHGRDHRETLRARFDIAVNLAAHRERGAEAERILTAVLAEQRRLFGADDPDIGDTASSLAGLYAEQSRLAEAEPLYLISMESSLRKYGAKSPLGTVRMSLLGNLYEKQGRYEEAEKLFQRIHDLRAAAIGPEHPDALEELARVGDIKLLMGRTAEAELLFQRLFESQRKNAGEANTQTLAYLMRLQSIYQAKGRYQEADEALKQALVASDHLQDDRFFNANRVRTRLVESLQLQGKTAEAQPLIDQLLRYWRTSYEKWGAGENGAFYAENLARVSCAYGRADDGVQLYRRILPARQALLGRDSPEVIQMSLEFADCLRSAYLPQESLPLLQRAAEARERQLGWDHPDTIRAANSLALAYLNLGRTQDALPLFKRAAERGAAVFGAGGPDTVILHQNYLWSLNLTPGTEAERVSAARVVVSGLRQIYQAREGSGAAQAIVETAKRQRADQFLLLPDAFVARTSKGPSPTPVELDELYAALQDATSGTANRALGQAMVRKLAAARSGEIGALVRERQDLVARAEETDTELIKASVATDEFAATRRGNLQKARAALMAQLAQTDARLRSGFPEFFDILQSAPATLRETQAALAPDEAILLVIPAQSGSHLMAISATEVRWAHSAWTKDQVGKAVTRLLWDVGADVKVDPATERAWNEAAGGRLVFDRATAHALYGQVVEPVVAVLAGKRHVFVSAGGALSGLPFGVLVTATPKGSDSDPAALRATAWFADVHDLTVIPSIQSLLFQRRAGRGRTAPAAAGLSFSGYGDPVLDGEAQVRGARPVRGVPVRAAFQSGLSRSGAGLVDVAQLKRLARLPGTATELEGIRAALAAPATSLHLRVAASEGALKRADLSGVRILAFATHGLLAGELSGASEPGLVFTPPRVASADDDGLLTASEVAVLRLDADWVILSACNTAAGDGSAGAPGLSGLARSFFYAGAHSLLVSHWPVRDDVAARLTVDAVKLRQAKPGMTRAEALRRAMQGIRDDTAHDIATDTWAHPSAWAPFSLVSDGAP